MEGSYELGIDSIRAVNLEDVTKRPGTYVNSWQFGLGNDIYLVKHWKRTRRSGSAEQYDSQWLNFPIAVYCIINYRYWSRCKRRIFWPESDCHSCAKNSNIRCHCYLCCIKKHYSFHNNMRKHSGTHYKKTPRTSGLSTLRQTACDSAATATTDSRWISDAVSIFTWCWHWIFVFCFRSNWYLIDTHIILFLDALVSLSFFL